MRRLLCLVGIHDRYPADLVHPTSESSQWSEPVLACVHCRSTRPRTTESAFIVWLARPNHAAPFVRKH